MIPPMPPPRPAGAPPMPPSGEDGIPSFSVPISTRRLRDQFAQAALPQVIALAEAKMPVDMDPHQAAVLIAEMAFDIADACVAEAEKRGG